MFLENPDHQSKKHAHQHSFSKREEHLNLKRCMIFRKNCTARTNQKTTFKNPLKTNQPFDLYQWKTKFTSQFYQAPTTAVLRKKEFRSKPLTFPWEVLIQTQRWNQIRMGSHELLSLALNQTNKALTRNLSLCKTFIQKRTKCLKKRRMKVAIVWKMLLLST